MAERSGYYLNSLREWRRRWFPDNASLKRLDTLRAINHPIADDHAALIDFQREIVAMIDAKIETAEGGDG